MSDSSSVLFFKRYLSDRYGSRDTDMVYKAGEQGVRPWRLHDGPAHTGFDTDKELWAACDRIRAEGFSEGWAAWPV